MFGTLLSNTILAVKYTSEALGKISFQLDENHGRLLEILGNFLEDVKNFCKF